MHKPHIYCYFNAFIWGEALINLNTYNLDADLWTSVSNNDYQRVQQLIFQGANPNAPCFSPEWKDWTILTYALHRGTCEIVASLAKSRFVDFNQTIPEGKWKGWTLLSFAVLGERFEPGGIGWFNYDIRKAHTFFVKTLLDGGAYPNQLIPEGTWRGWSLLAYAVRLGRDEIVRELLIQRLQFILNPNQIMPGDNLGDTWKGWSLLAFAVHGESFGEFSDVMRRSCHAIVGILLECGAYPDQYLTYPDYRKLSLLELAAQRGNQVSRDRLFIALQFVSAKSYMKARAKGEFVPEANITSLHLNAEDWSKLGNIFYFGYHGEKQNPLIAKWCFEQAFRINCYHPSASLILGYMHEDPKYGFPVDLVAARNYYRLGNHRIHLKRVERKAIEQALEKGEGLNRQDKEGDTALHRAAKNKFLKLFTSLRYLGADPTIINREGRTPESYLDPAQKFRVDRLQLLTNATLNGIRQDAPTFILSNLHLTVIRGDLDSDKCTIKLRKLCNIPEIRPLLDLTKLAMLGKHKLSQRGEAHRDNPDLVYDSDDEAPMMIEQKLSITIDPHTPSVRQQVCSVERAHGIYDEAQPNSIVIGNGRDIIETTGEIITTPQSTMIHEICHFIAKEVFNHCLPYRNNDVINRERFTKIAEEMLRNKDRLLPIFQVFHNYPPEAWHGELIVRIPQYLAVDEELKEHMVNDRLGKLESGPEGLLLQYYREVFLPEVLAHTERLRQNAVGIGWSPKLFDQNVVRGYHLSHVPPQAGPSSSNSGLPTKMVTWKDRHSLFIQPSS